jgi:hypothetical protein
MLPITFSQQQLLVLFLSKSKRFSFRRVSSFLHCFSRLKELVAPNPMQTQNI